MHKISQKIKQIYISIIASIKDAYSKLDKIDLLTTVVIFIASILSGFYFIIGKGVNADAVHLNEFYVATSDWELMLGRPFIQIVNSLHFGFNNHLIIILFASIALSISVIALRRIFRINNTTVLVLLSILFAVAPQFAETYFFAFTADAYLAAFMLAIITVYCLVRDFRGHYVLAVLTTILCCGLYQAYLSVIVGVFMAYSLKTFLENDTFKKPASVFLKGALTLLLGVILYYIFVKFILTINGLELADYRGANEINITQIITQAPAAFIQCYQQFILFFFKSYSGIVYNGGYHRNYFYLVLFTMLGLYCLLTIIALIRKHSLLKAGVLLITFTLIPVFTNIVNFITLSGTSLIMLPGYLAIPLFYIAICTGLFSRTRTAQMLHNVGIVICSIVCYTYFLGNTQSFTMRNQTHDDYVAILSDIYSKATNLNTYNVGQEWIFNDIIITNTFNSEYSNGGTAVSPITWRSYGGIMTNSFFYSKYLSINIKMANESAYRQIQKTSDYQKMPVYPNPGSIQVINNYVVVKITKDGI